MRARPAIRRLVARLVDDAALFPPGNAPMPDAVPAHLRHRSAWYGEVVGPFVCSDARLLALQAELEHLPDGAVVELALLTDLSRAAAASPHEGPRGAVGLETRVQELRADPRLALVAVEVSASGDDPGAAVRAVAAATAEVAGSCAVYLEVPRGEAMPAVLDVIAAAGLRAKLRTGGAGPAAVPTPDEVAAFLLGCVQRGIACKCTAGLHHALRRPRADGVDEHGFLNVLLAARRAAEGAPRGAVAAVLDERDAARIRAEVRALDEGAADETRRRFCSFGSCSVTEPVADLVDLGLVEPAAERVAGAADVEGMRP